MTILDDRGHFCVGVLVASRYVLTAGHCLMGDGDTDFQVSQSPTYDDVIMTSPPLSCR